MSLTFAAHQFEVRFSPILDFSDIYREILAPYAKLASNISLENENQLNGKHLFSFQTSSYSLTFMWDRIVIRYEGDMRPLIESNSIVEDPYFAILDKFRDRPSFGILKNFVSYIVGVRVIDSVEIDLVNAFNNKFLNVQAGKEVMPRANDTGITLEERSFTKSINVQFGPFLGLEDLAKEKINPSTNEVIDLGTKKGLIIKSTIVEHSAVVNFQSYKRTVGEAISIMERVCL